MNNDGGVRSVGEKRAYKPRKPSGGRKKLKPEHDAGKNLKEQMDAAVALYNSEMSLQAIADALNRPKALGDIRGVTYIYGMFYRFGLIDVPDGVKKMMKKTKTHRNKK